ncbi:MAG: S53 family peptidase [Candidatus Acidiferrum sp.]
MLTHSRKNTIAVALMGLTLVALLATFLESSYAAPTAGTAYSLTGNTPGFIKKATDLGVADPTTLITVTVWLNLHNQQQLDQLVLGQNQKSSPNYHKWISQSSFNATFSPTSQEVKSVQNFLTAHGLSVLAVAENNFYIKVQGSIGDVEKAFHVSIHNYSLNGQTLRSNTSDPSVNDSSGAHVAAITGLDDFGFQPNVSVPTDAEGEAYQPIAVASSPNGFFFEAQCFRAPQTQTFTNPSAGVTATYTGNRFGADITNNTLGHLAPCGYQPSEMQTAYGMTPLYAQGLDGSGETVVIVDAYGSSTIAQDAEIFSQIYGLPDITSQNFSVVKAPGLVNNPKGPARNWDLETSLDVEWAHAMAPGANIALVVATDRASLDEAINYAVVHHIGNTISNSWSSIEGFGNPRQLDRVNRILEMAAAQGIDVNFASGDRGDEFQTVGFLSVDFPASSPFATGIGGTSLALNPDNSAKFQTGWGTNITRIANRISQGSTPPVPPIHFGFQFGAGGGASLTFAKPAFQSGLPGAARLVPDISMLADPFTGAEIIQTIGGQTFVEVIGGTSLATPMFSAVMSVAAQKNNHVGLGQAAALVYTLPSGAVSDVVPFSSPDNVTGSITTPSGTFTFSADNLAAPLQNTTEYFSAMYNSPFSTRWSVLTFGTDSSLVVTPGWDNVTGVGTPNGQPFIDALVP